MERITFGDTDGDAEGILLREIATAHYVVGIDGKDYVLQSADNIGVMVREYDPEGLLEGVGPVIRLAYQDFTELHIF